MKSKKTHLRFDLSLIKSFPSLLWVKTQFWRQQILSGISAGRTQYLVTLALIVGVVAGLSAFLFHLFIDILSRVTVGQMEGLTQNRWGPRALLFLVPALGGLAVGGLMRLLKPEFRQQGVPEVIHSLLKRSGRMKIRATIVKSWSAIFTIGSGGSAGPEGPIAEIGAATGSFLGRLFTAPPSLMRMLVAGGAAGGIAASFHAPFAGVFFALEVLLSEFNNRAFSVVVLCTVTATLVSRALLGGEAYFSAPLYTLGPSWELILFALLGIIAGFAAKGYVRFLNGLEVIFSEIKKVPSWLKPAIGGLLVGGLALITPQILGGGHHIIEEALWGRLSFHLLLALLLGKMLATSITLGSGGVGGVFLPGLFVGAMLGGAFGMLVKFFSSHLGIPFISPSGAFALVGMAALLAGATRAPMTSIMIILEITDDHHMILPVMIAGVLATLVARSMEKNTIYTRHLSMRGIKEPEHHSVRALESTTVGEIMSKKVVTVSPALPLDRLARLIETRGHSGFPVVNLKKELVGLVTFEELRNALGVEDLPRNLIITGDLMRTPPPTVYPDQTIGEALSQLKTLTVDRLVVISRDNPKAYLGIVTQSDILAIYRKLLI